MSTWVLRIGDFVINQLGEQRPHFFQSRHDLLIPSVGVAPNGIDSEVAIILQRTIADRQLHEDIVIEHYGAQPAHLELRLHIESDFADIFEVRRRDWQQRRITTRWGNGTLRSEYRAPEFVRIHELDVRSPGVIRHEDGMLCADIDLAPGETWHTCLHHRLLDDADLHLPAMDCPMIAGVPARGARSSTALAGDTPPRATPPRRRGAEEPGPNAWTVIHAAEPRLQRAITQARDDLESLVLRSGPRRIFPAAGIPWFATLFGRDALITSMQTLILGPEFALGSLDQLGRLQARAVDRYRDAEPGKICHEMRVGEWARSGRVPQRPYYGSADATPLYLWLLGELYRWHGDAAGLRRFRPVAERCLRWIDNFGDIDGDGFQEYGPREATGYPNQCWRDSPDGVPDETGATPPHPIATCELQGYVYAAKMAMAPLFEAWGDRLRADRLRDEGRLLKARFDESFWMPELGTYALALDGQRRVVPSLTSNPGHLLWTGIVDARRRRSVAEQLLSPGLFSGFGIRTLDARHAAYDPHSYHRGSVWPHDSVIGAAGLRSSGHEEHAWRVIEGLVAAAARFPGSQLPELFSGLDRRQTSTPVPYWRANVPQAWAAGSVIHAVATLLGIEPDLPAGRLHLAGTLPPWCPSIRVNGLRLGESRFDLAVHRSGDGVDVDVRGWSGTPPEVVLGPRLS